MFEKKVIVHLSGGLGNQMFQYMAGSALARATNREFSINLNWFLNPAILHRNDSAYLTKRKIDIIQFSEIAATKIDRWPTPRDGRMERVIARLGQSTRESIGIATEVGFQNNTWLRGGEIKRLFGFFMSPKYFLGMDPQPIFSNLEPPMSGWSRKIGDQIRTTKSIGVHIRLGDYVSLGDKVIPTEAYFLAGVNYLKSKLGDDAKVYFFTDEPDRVSQLFPILVSFGTIVSPPSYTTPAENLLVLSKCSSFVCSNSTFSWWGAALSAAPDSLLVRPSYFYTEKPKEDSHADLWAIDSMSLDPTSGAAVEVE
jgi:hypothetical protein